MRGRKILEQAETKQGSGKKTFFSPLLPLAIALGILLSGCGTLKPASTISSSANLQTLEEKVDFLQNYLSFTRSFADLEYHIYYQNAENRLRPVLAEWEMILYARVPVGQVPLWISQLQPIDAPEDTSWASKLPRQPLDLEALEWYGDKHRTIGLKEGGEMLYLNTNLHLPKPREKDE